MDWPLVELAPGSFADVLIQPLDDGAAHCLLTDASAEHAARQPAQQHANETALLNRRLRAALASLEAAQATLEHKNDQLHALSQAKGRFIANLSHELRTPLTAIMGHTQLLRTRFRADPDALDDGLEAIEAGAEHLMSMVNNVLDQASLETGQLAINAAPTDIPRLIGDVSDLLRPMARQHGLDFRLRTPSGVLAWCETDATRLRQVLINLCTNAIKFTRCGHVELAARWQDGRLGIRVTDTGPGIPEHQRERILLPFQRGDAARGHSGVGLGLTISLEIVRLMCGELTFEPNPPGGSIFRFEVPAPAFSETRRTDGDADRDRVLAGRPVLLVDDLPEIRLLYSTLLETAGLEVSQAADTATALESIASDPPEAIIVDRHLGDDDGADLIRRLRDDGYRGAVIAWSASSMRGDREAPLVAGADVYLVKPVPPPVLQETLRKLLAG